MKYFGGCDVGSTYTKAVIVDENGKIVADTTMKSKINAEEIAKLAMAEVLKQVGLEKSEDLAFLNLYIQVIYNNITAVFLCKILCLNHCSHICISPFIKIMSVS